MKKKESKLVFYVALLVAFMLAIFVLAHSAINDFNSFRTHQNYFRNNHPQIESWMTPNSVLRHFNVSESDLFRELNVTNSSKNLVTPISKICTTKKIDCQLLLERLNNLVK